MKNPILSLLVVAAAAGTSAFTNVPAENHGRAIWYYGLNETGKKYVALGTNSPNLDNCLTNPTPKCIVGYDSNRGASLEANTLPSSGMVYQSPYNGFYNPE